MRYFHIFPSEDKKNCFEIVGDGSSKSEEPIFVLAQWENNNVLVDKMKILQENAELMSRYSLNLDNLVYNWINTKCGCFKWLKNELSYYVYRRK